MLGAMLEYLYDAWAVSLTDLLNAGVEWRRYKIKPIRATQTEARAGARLDDRS